MSILGEAFLQYKDGTFQALKPDPKRHKTIVELSDSAPNLRVDLTWVSTRHQRRRLARVATKGRRGARHIPLQDRTMLIKAKPMERKEFHHDVYAISVGISSRYEVNAIPYFFKAHVWAEKPLDDEQRDKLAKFLSATIHDAAMKELKRLGGMQ